MLNMNQNFAKSQLTAIGNTPLLLLSGFAPNMNVFAKLESANPLGSIKDRAAWGMIAQAQQEGKLLEGGTMVEPTSGNTGIALAWISKILGYKLILTMPENMSEERRKIMSFLGAELVLTKAATGMSGAITEAKEIAAKEQAFMPNQFSNNGNWMAHFNTTGPEIWQQMEEKIDIAVFGVGTGGTLMGTGKFLKSKNAKMKIVAVEPATSAVLSGGMAGSHKIQGIGAGFIPKILDVSLIDEVEKVSNEEAIKGSQQLATTEGVFAGISSGAAVWAALRQAQKNPGKRIVTVLPDTADRYVSTELFSL